ESTSGQTSGNTQQQEVPTVSHTNNQKSSKNKQTRQAPFQVKNAPWTNGNEHENDYQQKSNSRQRSGQNNSPMKSIAPDRDDLGNDLLFSVVCFSKNSSFCLGEYPSFSNGLSSTTTTTTTTTTNNEDGSSQVHTTTVNSSIPVAWGPPKRNHN
ncbi:MAG: hypothetical protein JNN26_27215, partial [Candidatus Obscuribacter sp.]|nr:hypothetical protein [Candidatus Obscuribacter sp.]